MTRSRPRPRERERWGTPQVEQHCDHVHRTAFDSVLLTVTNAWSIHSTGRCIAESKRLLTTSSSFPPWEPAGERKRQGVAEILDAFLDSRFFIVDNTVIGTLQWVLHVDQSGKYSAPTDQLLHFPGPSWRSWPVQGFPEQYISLTNYSGVSRDYVKKLV
ncbi:hypothetical protein AURDEDRAFT_168917 [Auricularia subglabra TFB-10046 SS5]|nr:hypothetical protein AURDEDRAFT_168917 [Auricularia subglabra TFB-10046 SS5]